MSEERGRGNGAATVREMLDKAPEIQPNAAVFDEVDVAALNAKHHSMITDLDQLADWKRKADAGVIEHAVFEAERLNLAEKYKKQGLTPAKALAAVEQRLRPPMSDDEATQTLAEGRGQRDEVLAIGRAGELWHDPDLEAFATIRREGRRETWKVRSRDYRLYLHTEYRHRHGRVPSGQALTEGMEAIEAEARDGVEHEAFVRVAGADGKVYLDLVNDAWTVVEIAAAGWRVISNPPVRFIRPRGLRPLPEPKASSNGIDKLKRLVNLRGDDFKLYVSWVLACLQPTGPYPILVLSGEQGAAKSTAVKIARDLVDPGKVKLSGPPRSEQDLAIAASKRHVVAYDNLSEINGWLADALCRLATGGGLQKRMLFTDDEQNLIAVCRPVAVTGIPDLTSRADLADRAIVAVLEPISKGRREEEELWAAFEDSAPVILGALLAGVAQALRDRASQSKAIKEKPRMADFAVWAAAAMPAFGWKPDDFLRAYKGNREEAVARVLEADPVAEAVIEFARQAYSWGPLKLEDGTLDETMRFWKDTSTMLLGELAKLVPEDIRRERSWPKDATRLSGCLRRAAPALRTKRIKVNFFRERLELPDGRRGEARRMVSIAAPASEEGDMEGDI